MADQTVYHARSGQFRRLCDAMRTRELPFSQPDVATLVRQALYHIGTLTPSGDSLLWRTDWQPGGDMLPALLEELESLANELRDTPREHDAVLILGEAAAYLSLWHPPLKDIARRFSEMTREAADALEAQILDSATNPAQQQQLQARQCHLRMVSLLCFGPGEMRSAEEAAIVVKLMVQIRHRHVFLDAIDNKTAARLSALHHRCHNVMARHGPSLAWLASLHQHEVLREAVASVLERTPGVLQWGILGATGSFESVGPDGHLYSINLLDGSVLLDGVPPGRLPKGILSHPLYRRSFGDRNFEVAVTASGVLETLKPVKGRLYNFLLSDGKLVVTEIDKDKVRWKGIQICDDWLIVIII